MHMEVYNTLQNVPRLFQQWVAKQVWDLAGTDKMQYRYTEGHEPHCPSSNINETYHYIRYCEEAGRLDAINCWIDWLDTWLEKNETEPTLWYVTK